MLLLIAAQRKAKVTTLIHRQETISLLGIPLICSQVACGRTTIRR